jgi:hypothetical protein
MTSEDRQFLDLLSDAERRQGALNRWARSRRWSFVAASLFLVLSAGVLLLGAGPLCGLFAGVSAINFAAATSMDMKIKLALLAGRGLASAGSSAEEAGDRGAP